MNQDDLKHLIEATLLAAGRPVTQARLLELFEERERPTQEQLDAAFEALSSDYESRGIEVLEVASGWRIQVRPRYVDVVSRLWQERPSRYSRALLETLALIAYRQPITRSEIEEIRGVSISSTIMRTLQERSWIRTVGHREVPGRPELLGTTREFLDYFGLKSLEQLPTLAELKDVETIGVQLELPADGQIGADEESLPDATAGTDVAASGEPGTLPVVTGEAASAMAGEATATADEAAAANAELVTPAANAGHDMPDLAARSSGVDQDIEQTETSDDIAASHERSDDILPQTEVSDAPARNLGQSADTLAGVGDSTQWEDASAGAALAEPAHDADPMDDADDADMDDADDAADDEGAGSESSARRTPTLVAGSDVADGGRAIGDPSRSS